MDGEEKSMIKLQVIGHLGRDASINYNQSRAVINFTVAHTEKYKNAQGVQSEKTTWVTCSYWTDKTTIAEYLKKGTLVFVEGQPDVKMWENNQGNSRADLTLRVQLVQLLSSKKDSQQTNQPSHQPAPQDKPVDDAPETFDDLPF